MQMITSVFETILLLSLLGTVAALAVTLLSAAVKRKINSSWLCSIHLLVLLFFLVPFWLVFDLPVKAIDVSGQLNGVIPAEIEPIDSVERNEKDQFDMDKRNEVIPTGNDLGASPSERSGNEVPIHDSPAAKTGFKEILVFCWIAGGLIVSMKHFIGYRKFKVQIEKSNIEVRDRKTLDLLERYKKEMNIKKIALSINPCVQSPILFGFQRACIIIPNLSFSYGDLVMILKHECIHYKRKDNYIKLLGLGVKCVHWFNPAVYCHFSKINQLCEMACDEKLIKTLDYEGRKQYVLMIIHALEMIKKERQGIFAAFGSNLKTVERRVKNIMCEKKPDSKGYISFITVTALICFFTIGVAYAISPDKEMTKAEAESLKNLTTVDNQGEQVENQAIADLVAEEMQKYGVSVENAETVIDSKIQTILSNELAVLPDNTSYSGIITDLATGEILAAAGNVTDKIYPGMALRGVIGAIVEDSGITDSMAKASDDPLIYTDGADTDSIRYWNANERKGFQSLQQTIVNSCEPALARFFSELEPDGALEYLKGFGLIPEDTSSKCLKCILLYWEMGK